MSRTKSDFAFLHRPTPKGQEPRLSDEKRARLRDLLIEKCRKDERIAGPTSEGLLAEFDRLGLSVSKEAMQEIAIWIDGWACAREGALAELFAGVAGERTGLYSSDEAAALLRKKFKVRLNGATLRSLRLPGRRKSDSGGPPPFIFSLEKSGKVVAAAESEYPLAIIQMDGGKFRLMWDCITRDFVRFYAKTKRR